MQYKYFHTRSSSSQGCFHEHEVSTYVPTSFFLCGRLDISHESSQSDIQVQEKNIDTEENEVVSNDFDLTITFTSLKPCKEKIGRAHVWTPVT